MINTFAAHCLSSMFVVSISRTSRCSWRHSTAHLLKRSAKSRICNVVSAAFTRELCRATSNSKIVLCQALVFTSSEHIRASLLHRVQAINKVAISKSNLAGNLHTNENLVSRGHHWSHECTSPSRKARRQSEKRSARAKVTSAEIERRALASGSRRRFKR